jgi:hypothetical protein
VAAMVALIDAKILKLQNAKQALLELGDVI